MPSLQSCSWKDSQRSRSFSSTSSHLTLAQPLESPHLPIHQMPTPSNSNRPASNTSGSLEHSAAHMAGVLIWTTPVLDAGQRDLATWTQPPVQPPAIRHYTQQRMGQLSPPNDVGLQTTLTLINIIIQLFDPATVLSNLLPLP